MRERFSVIVKWIIRTLLTLGLLGLVVVVWGFITMLRPHVRDMAAPDYDRYVTEFGPTDLPAAAKNIRYVASSVGMGGRAHICRFEAPIDDCKKYALTEYGRYDLDRDNPGEPPQFEPMSSRPEKPDLSPYGIRDLSWFDAQNIVEGITLPRDHPHRPVIWIDVKRKVYCSYWTD